MKRSLGTQLRHLIELLDGAVGAAYEEAGLTYRPRYTPVMRALMQNEPATIGHIATAAGITQPAATQTIALMVKQGLVTTEAGVPDGRQKLIRLSPQGRELLPKLQQCWQATAAAAASLEAECALSSTIEAAIEALAARPYGERIRAARAVMVDSGKS
ncbi:MarR family transcriptional regulator [Massilia eurypsychrophila]|jgi:DNA-binding MarR family transcriptional regulator|uniref:MarR family transcriptional regulator n=1 Tax=Massilia eurypsychrophila TaxID=1485217 RepID=A0A2G8T9Q0_9BURK|nr:MarR family transcriptional regulator [Massilia eurypsychrophila]PIL42709.1 MarR family transcriptional regulator [Massilia eurypsychrophila]